MKLDVIVPSYNRAALLARTLDSLASARCPNELDVTVIVVDNASTDNTRDVVEQYKRSFPHKVRYLLENVRGSSAALNTGIRAGKSELIGIINDDEEVDVAWFEVAHSFFSDGQYQFAGGPYYPRWGAEKPKWIVREHGAVVGWVDGGAERREYGAGFHGILMGGNAFIRRSAFEVVGFYNTALGRTEKGLLSCEDEDLFDRLLAHGFRGVYLPELIIYHYIPAERLTRQYHRAWFFGRGISKGVLATTRNATVKELFGIPRWQIRYAAEGAVSAVKGLMRLTEASAAFQGELRLWDLAGYLKGRFGTRVPRESV